MSPAASSRFGEPMSETRRTFITIFFFFPWRATSLPSTGRYPYRPTTCGLLSNKPSCSTPAAGRCWSKLRPNITFNTWPSNFLTGQSARKALYPFRAPARPFAFRFYTSDASYGIGGLPTTFTAPNLSSNFYADLGGGTIVYGRINTVSPMAVAAIPEPASWAMMIVGVGAIGGGLRQRRRATVAFA